MNFNFQALGCRLNEAELELWGNQLIKMGHQITSDSQDADIVVFNSCAVTGEADRKSRQQINRLHRSNPQAGLVVTGCHASLNTEAVKNYLGVDLVVGNADKENLVENLVQYFDIARPITKLTFKIRYFYGAGIGLLSRFRMVADIDVPIVL